MKTNSNNRFKFGKNWQNFLSVLNNDRIIEAEKALVTFLRLPNLKGKTFLDIGAGSGIHSLSALRLSAAVHSFDFDHESVTCIKKIKENYYPNNPHWTIDQGSILDRQYIEGLGKFDICYAWGCLHHTGSLWQALYNAHIPVSDGGYLFIAIYNDQGVISELWKIIKRAYCSHPIYRIFLIPVFYSIFFFSGLVIDLLHFTSPFKRFIEHKKFRGMSLIHDWKDWLGGYPYEPANPQQIISYYENLGYKLINFAPPKHGFGNNQFLFLKTNKW